MKSHFFTTFDAFCATFAPKFCPNFFHFRFAVLLDLLASPVMRASAKVGFAGISFFGMELEFIFTFLKNFFWILLEKLEIF